MAQQCEDEGPATDISRQGRQGERPDKVAPGQISIKHQIKDLDRAHHNMGGIRQGDKPGHENNHHDFGGAGDRKPYILMREAYFQRHDFIANGGKLTPADNPNAQAIQDELKDIDSQ